jgi:hypothetical protein
VGDAGLELLAGRALLQALLVLGDGALELRLLLGVGGVGELLLHHGEVLLAGGTHLLVHAGGHPRHLRLHHLLLHPLVLGRVVAQLLGGADLGGHEVRGVAQRAHGVHQAGLLALGLALLLLLAQALGGHLADLHRALLDGEVHLHLALGQLAVGGRLVLVLAGLLEDVERAGLLEVLLDRRLVVPPPAGGQREHQGEQHGGGGESGNGAAIGLHGGHSLQVSAAR